MSCVDGGTAECTYKEFHCRGASQKPSQQRLAYNIHPQNSQERLKQAASNNMRLHCSLQLLPQGTGWVCSLSEGPVVRTCIHASHYQWYQPLALHRHSVPAVAAPPQSNCTYRSITTTILASPFRLRVSRSPSPCTSPWCAKMVTTGFQSNGKGHSARARSSSGSCTGRSMTARQCDGTAMQKSQLGAWRGTGTGRMRLPGLACKRVSGTACSSTMLPLNAHIPVPLGQAPALVEEGVQLFSPWVACCALTLQLAAGAD